MRVVTVSQYKKSIYEIGLSKEEEAVIWDFYVTRSFAASASQKRTIKEFGYSQIPLKQMLELAGITNDTCKILPCTTMPSTIKSLGLETSAKDKNGNKVEIGIDIDTPRLCCIQKFTVTDEQGISPAGSAAECLLTHIRNSFAHGNTYFFDNGNVLLEDKDGNKITARILIPVRLLLEWIILIDKNGTVYPNLHHGKAKISSLENTNNRTDALMKNVS